MNKFWIHSNLGNGIIVVKDQIIVDSAYVFALFIGQHISTLGQYLKDFSIIRIKESNYVN